MENGGFCPIFTGIAEIPRECFEDECRWWFEKERVCSITQLVSALYDIRQELIGIKDR